MLAEVLFVVGGLALLVFSADVLIESSASLAQRFAIPPLLIGVSVVAFGTSAPELVVAIQSTLHGAGGLAIGNIVGSNIANVFLVLGLPALLAPIACKRGGTLVSLGVMLAATVGFAYVAYGGEGLSLRFALVALAALALYIGFVIRGSIQEAADDVAGSKGDRWVIAKLLASFIGLAVGSELLVSNAVTLADRLSVRAELLGVTIIAIGTSLPELATVFASVRRQQADLAIGNVIGSNIFNILAVGGAVGLAGGAAFSPETLKYELPLMIAAALVLSLYVLLNRSISKVSGLAMMVMFSVALSLAVMN